MNVETISREIDRHVARLPSLEPGSEEYSRVLNDVGTLLFLRRDLTYEVRHTGECKCHGDAAVVKAEIVPAETAPAVRIIPVAEEPVTMEEVEPEEAVEEESAYDLPTTRKMLGTARANGVNIVELLNEMGFENLSAVPSSRYTELLKKAGCI